MRRIGALRRTATWTDVLPAAAMAVHSVSADRNDQVVRTGWRDGGRSTNAGTAGTEASRLSTSGGGDVQAASVRLRMRNGAS